jgi:hypothetical protein
LGISTVVRRSWIWKALQRWLSSLMQSI